MQICNNGNNNGLTVRGGKCTTDPWHTSSPGKPSCPISGLFLIYLISSLCISKFLVFTQATCRGPFWDPIWATSSKLLYLFWFPEIFFDHCHPRKFLKKGSRAVLPHKFGSIFPLRLWKFPDPINRPWLHCGFGEGQAAFSISPSGAFRWLWISSTSQGCCEASDSLKMKAPGAFRKKGWLSIRCNLQKNKTRLSLLCQASYSLAFSWILMPPYSSRNLEANLGDFLMFNIEVPGKFLLHIP